MTSDNRKLDEVFTVGGQRAPRKTAYLDTRKRDSLTPWATGQRSLSAMGAVSRQSDGAGRRADASGVLGNVPDRAGSQFETILLLSIANHVTGSSNRCR
jgi:hypothetical protein